MAQALRSYRRRPLVIVAGVLLACILSLSAWAFWPQREGRTATIPVNPAEELDGELIASLWSDNKRGLQVDEPGALPARRGELVHVEARLNQPAYIYLFWIDGQGQASPLYPWDPKAGLAVPRDQQIPQKVVHSPHQYDQGWELDGNAGLETVMLLARRTPLPDEGLFTELFHDLPPSPLRDPLEHAIINPEAGAQKQAVGHHRGFNASETKAIDEPLLKLMERLRPSFEFVRAVRFAHSE
jgi:hypothetical protein